MRIRRAVPALVAAALLTACAAPPAAPPAGPSQARLATMQAPPMDGSAQATLNRARAAAGLPQLSRHRTLDRAALQHAQDMVVNDFYSHASSNGRNVRDRVNGAGYDSCMRAENIAWGQDTQAIVLGSWLGSPAHRRNILHPKARHFGLAGLRDPDGPYDPVWVMVLATTRC
jgi:uncharacterized protein YkwD